MHPIIKCQLKTQFTFNIDVYLWRFHPWKWLQPRDSDSEVQQASWLCYLLVHGPATTLRAPGLFFFSCNCRVCHLLSESSLAKLWWRWLNRSSCNGEDTSSHAVATPEYVAHTIKEVTHFYWFFCFFVCFLKMLLIKFVLDSFTHVYNMLRLPSPPTFSCLPSTPITLSLCRSLPPSHSCPFALRLTWFKQSHLCDHMCGTTH